MSDEESQESDASGARIAAGPVVHFDQIPPAVAYAIGLARTKKHPLQIVEESGLSASTFFRIARSKSWNNIAVGKLGKFCRAVEVDLLCPGNELRYLKEALKRGCLFTKLRPGQRKRIEQVVAEILLDKMGPMPAPAVPMVLATPEPQS